jgi:hypothetical protein
MTAFILALGIAFGTAQQSDPSTYRVTLLLAAPGALLELLDVVTRHGTTLEAQGERTPVVLRHRQGDHWDLFVLYPIGSMSSYYAPERIAQRSRNAQATDISEPQFEDTVRRLVAWRQDLFVSGPSAVELDAALDGGGFFHIEMFVALPGKHEALAAQRRMENAYLAALGRPQNLVFIREAGAEWDLFTLGVYRSLAHYAEGDAIPDSRADAAARAAGFEGGDRIGTYLRTLIAHHHDTLLSRVR